ncbi:MAG: SEC-C metal-binding domain-containing protein, partial [Planctomycetota bacterium]
LAIQREVTEEPPPPESLVSLTNWIKRKFLIEITPAELQNKTREEIEEFIIQRIKKVYDEKEIAHGEVEIFKEQPLRYTDEELKLPPEKLIEVIRQKIGVILKIDPTKAQFDINRLAAGYIPNSVEVLEKKEKKMRLLERFLMLDIIDTKWKDHLYNMDTLREGIYLRGYAQKDPKLEYKREGFGLFKEMFNSMKEQATDLVLKAQVSAEIVKQEVASVWNEASQQAVHQDAGSAYTGAAKIGGGSTEMAKQSEHGGETLKAVETIRRTKRESGPNDPCPCGSGKKYKKCHGRIGGGMDIIIPVKGQAGGREHKGHTSTGG